MSFGLLLYSPHPTHIFDRRLLLSPPSPPPPPPPFDRPTRPCPSRRAADGREDTGLTAVTLMAGNSCAVPPNPIPPPLFAAHPPPPSPLLSPPSHHCPQPHFLRPQCECAAEAVWAERRMAWAEEDTRDAPPHHDVVNPSDLGRPTMQMRQSPHINYLDHSTVPRRSYHSPCAESSPHHYRLLPYHDVIPPETLSTNLAGEKTGIESVLDEDVTTISHLWTAADSAGHGT